eukprot:GHRQ01038131.1.p1 GENE.GHRQ01038131.1~~GHRQ01038131.1.p1  ORF type:complete len:100 (-),score=10.16 GHRQ01038131.1:277-531(-)
MFPSRGATVPLYREVGPSALICGGTKSSCRQNSCIRTNVVKKDLNCWMSKKHDGNSAEVWVYTRPSSMSCLATRQCTCRPDSSA